MAKDKALTAKSSIGAWLKHPVGGPILRDLLAQGGQKESALAAQGCASSRSESTGNGRLNGFSSTLANRSGALSAPSAMSQICYTFVTSTSSIHGRPDSARAS